MGVVSTLIIVYLVNQRDEIARRFAGNVTVARSPPHDATNFTSAEASVPLVAEKTALK